MQRVVTAVKLFVCLLCMYKKILLGYYQRCRSFLCAQKLGVIPLVDEQHFQPPSLLCSVCFTYLGEGCSLHRHKDLTYCCACKASMEKQEQIRRRQKRQTSLSPRSS